MRQHKSVSQKLATYNASKVAQNMSNQHQNQFDAVIVRDLTYQIGGGRNAKMILNQINLTVPEGSIYGLLGPSGCGKTTMLRCVVGRIYGLRSSGTILLFGCQPGDKLAQVPGKNVGYMPQELSIYEDFSIEETLAYFGRINRMHSYQIRQRINFLVHFLALPSKQRLVTNLSGGQKRRVSLAAALVHSPPLLILDEPTVGVDPLLRQNIWQHLVDLTQSEKISVIITTHYIEEARQANVVGLMRNGKILAEDNPDELMRKHNLHSLEDVFLKLCMTDSDITPNSKSVSSRNLTRQRLNEINADHRRGRADSHLHRRESPKLKANQHESSRRLEANLYTRPLQNSSMDSDLESAPSREVADDVRPSVVGSTNGQKTAYTNQVAVENFSAEDSDDTTASQSNTHRERVYSPSRKYVRGVDQSLNSQEYIASQKIKWANRRNSILDFKSLGIDRLGRVFNRDQDTLDSSEMSAPEDGFKAWFDTLMAIAWKNFTRLRRNPPVLIFQFILPAIQVILFCLCIGGEPFDVPVAVVNEELDSSTLRPNQNQLLGDRFLQWIDSKIMRQTRYDNLSSAIQEVREGNAWGVIHVPAQYTRSLQERFINQSEEVNGSTIYNGTIHVYPDLTNLQLSMTMENTLREAFIKFANDYISTMGYSRNFASPPIRLAEPIYGTDSKDSYLEFMAPGVVVSISYVMATGLTALAFILERRDGLLERSLVSGVGTSQILLAHAINQVIVMTIQICLVLCCTFFVFEIPSRGPFVWVVILILLQGCTGMAFGLLVSAVCKEENTAVMIVVGTFYTNLILAGIIWPIDAMPHWIRPLGYAQPQTIPTEALRNILSRGWTITDFGVAIGYLVTLGWLVVFLFTAGLLFKYLR